MNTDLDFTRIVNAMCDPDWNSSENRKLAALARSLRKNEVGDGVIYEALVAMTYEYNLDGSVKL